MTSSMQPRRISLERASVQAIGDDTLVYDELHHQAWCLNRSCACIWRLCDGQKTVQHIAAAAAGELDAPVTLEIVLLTLAELREKNLIDPKTVRHLPEDVTRRAMIGGAGLAAVALLPVIASILAPPAHAQGGSLGGKLKRPEPKSNGEKA